MHSRKSARPRLEHWRTPTLTGYTCENFLFRNTRSRLLLRKDEIRPNIWPEVPQDFSLWRRLAWQTLSKSFNIATATARVPPDLLNILATLSDTTVRRSTIDREDLKPYWKSEKMLHFSRWSISLLFKYFTLQYSTLEPPEEYNHDQVLLTNRAAEWRRYSRFTFVENTISNSPKVVEPSFSEVIDTFDLLASVSLAGSGTLLLQLLTSLSELYFRFKRFIPLVQTEKKRFLWTMTAVTAAENHEMSEARLDIYN